MNKKKLGDWMRLWIVGSLLWAPFALASDRILPRDSTIYIEKTDFDFHVYLKAAIIKKKLPLKVVRKKENADFHLRGTAQHARGKRFTAALEIWNRQDVLVWAAEAGGGSLYDRAVGGLDLRKAASNLANKLKKVIQTKKEADRGEERAPIFADATVLGASLPPCGLVLGWRERMGRTDWQET